MQWRARLRGIQHAQPREPAVEVRANPVIFGIGTRTGLAVDPPLHPGKRYRGAGRDVIPRAHGQRRGTGRRAQVGQRPGDRDLERGAGKAQPDPRPRQLVVALDRPPCGPRRGPECLVQRLERLPPGSPQYGRAPTSDHPPPCRALPSREESRDRPAQLIHFVDRIQLQYIFHVCEFLEDRPPERGLRRPRPRRGLWRQARCAAVAVDGIGSGERMPS